MAKQSSGGIGRLVLRGKEGLVPECSGVCCKGEFTVELIYQRFWHSAVTRLAEEEVMSITNFLDSHTEIRVMLKIGVNDLLIRDAVVETFREKDRKSAEPLIYRPALQGIKAYFGAGKPVKEAMSSQPQLVEPVLENIMAVIQAESYFYQERGFESAEAYDEFWDQNYRGTCKYYSNLELVQERFMANIQPKHRSTHLFGRYRNVAVFSLGPETLQVNVNFSDSFHEMAINFTCRGKEYRIDNIEAWMLRCPDQICRQAVLDLQGVVGLDLAGAQEKEIMKRSGSGQGCTHLGLMTVDAARALQAVG